MSEQHMTDKEAEGLGFVLMAFAVIVVFGPILYAYFRYSK